MTTRHKKAGQSEKKTTPAPQLDHPFQRPELLTWALTHRSLAYETNPDSLPNPTADNEQLEFVGDAVLGLVVAESLFHRFSASREGELTRLRSSLVSRRHLGEVSGGRRKPALLANALEAVIAALYLDGGLDAARAFIEKHIIEPTLPDLHLAMQGGDTFSGAIGDHKSALQEHLQATGAGQPHYVLTDQSGPDHQKRFRVEVRIQDKTGGSRALAESEGTTKKQAQQDAARLAFQRLISEAQPAAVSAVEVPE